MKKLESLEELKKRTEMGVWKTAVIVFKESSFNKLYNEISRSYRISRENKYFHNNMIGSSLYGDCLDGTDDGVELIHYIRPADKKQKAWEVEYCYIENDI